MRPSITADDTTRCMRRRLTDLGARCREFRRRDDASVMVLPPVRSSSKPLRDHRCCWHMSSLSNSSSLRLPAESQAAPKNVYCDGGLPGGIWKSESCQCAPRKGIADSTIAVFVMFDEVYAKIIRPSSSGQCQRAGCATTRNLE